MAHVYRISSPLGTAYRHTARGADQCRPGGERPDEVARLDAAAECTRLHCALAQEEEARLALRALLREVRALCPGLDGTEVGQRLDRLLGD